MERRSSAQPTNVPPWCSTNSSNCSADVKFVTALCSARELKYYRCIGSAYEKFAVLTVPWFQRFIFIIFIAKGRGKIILNLWNQGILTVPKNKNFVHESEQTTKQTTAQCYLFVK
jgi:hypothetical protein